MSRFTNLLSLEPRYAASSSSSSSSSRESSRLSSVPPSGPNTAPPDTWLNQPIASGSTHRSNTMQPTSSEWSGPTLNVESRTKTGWMPQQTPQHSPSHPGLDSPTSQHTSLEFISQGEASIAPAPTQPEPVILRSIHLKRPAETETDNTSHPKRLKEAHPIHPQIGYRDTHVAKPHSYAIPFHFIKVDGDEIVKHQMHNVTLVWPPGVQKTTACTFNRIELVDAAAKAITPPRLYQLDLPIWVQPEHLEIRVYEVALIHSSLDLNLTNNPQYTMAEAEVKETMKGSLYKLITKKKLCHLQSSPNISNRSENTYCFTVELTASEPGMEESEPGISHTAKREEEEEERKGKGKRKRKGQGKKEMLSPRAQARENLEMLYQNLRKSLGYKLKVDDHGALILSANADPGGTILGVPDGDCRSIEPRYDKERNCVYEVTPTTELKDASDEALERLVMPDPHGDGDPKIKSEDKEGGLDSMVPSTPTSETRYGSHDQDASDRGSRSPSKRSTPAAHHDEQKTTNVSYLDGNFASGYPLAVGLDPRLYHPIFGFFTHRYEELYDEWREKIREHGHRAACRTTNEDTQRLHLVWELSNALCKLGVQETTRLRTIRPILCDLLGLPVQDFCPITILWNRHSPDIARLTRDLAADVIAELKTHRMASSKSLPRTQCLFGYISWLQAHHDKKWNQNTCCPTFLLTLVGNQLEISAVVCPSRAHVVSLLSIELGYSGYPNDDCNVLWKAHIAFSALNESLSKLKDYYEKLPETQYDFQHALVKIGEQDDMERHAHPRLFPWPNSFLAEVNGQKRRVFFRYLWPLHRASTCGIFVVRLISPTAQEKERHPAWDSAYVANEPADDEWLTRNLSLNVNDRVVIKFVREYGDKCHTYMAKEYTTSSEERGYLQSTITTLSFAPKLYGLFDYENKGGFLAGFGKMVVMEYLADWQALDTCDFADETRGRQVSRRLMVAVNRLHQGGYVHGDLRDANIMVERVPINPRVYIVDYDVADEGKTVLPARWSATCRGSMGLELASRKENKKGEWEVSSDGDCRMLEQTLKTFNISLQPHTS
ncbi:hypothetical protein V5O48_018171 [Marasmius crinis-equi]|uniref:Protein kinase domain-containing protein n=1 Tax=Marasmius crinis-equi TaxID=585013 RepID=A0ABR3ELX5_9AGAR